MEADYTSYESILDFWFGKLDGPSDIPKDKASKWFMKSDAFDKEIKDTFGHLFEPLLEGKLSHYASSAKGRLALIILCDQFSRNIFRNDKKAFAFDAIALELSLKGMELGHDKELYPVERSFFYLPLEHSEEKEMQEKSITAFTELLEDAPDDAKAFFENNLDYAYQHKRIIDRFGRYPHRNEALGRESTEEEKLFLKEKGSSF